MFCMFVFLFFLNRIYVIGCDMASSELLRHTHTNTHTDTQTNKYTYVGEWWQCRRPWTAECMLPACSFAAEKVLCRVAAANDQMSDRWNNVFFCFLFQWDGEKGNEPASVLFIVESFKNCSRGREMIIYCRFFFLCINGMLHCCMLRPSCTRVPCLGWTIIRPVWDGRCMNLFIFFFPS